MIDLSCPKCQVTGCFEVAQVYIVIRETDINSQLVKRPINSPYDRTLVIDNDNNTGDESDTANDVNRFKLILFLCARHDYDMKYLLRENELEISKRQHLFYKGI